MKKRGKGRKKFRDIPNKRGQTTHTSNWGGVWQLRGVGWFFALIIIAAIAVIIASLPETESKFGQYGQYIKTLGKYMFGVDENINVGSGIGTLSVAALVIAAIMIWFIIFVAFGEIFATFSSFSPLASWVIAFAIAVIAAVSRVTIIALTWVVGIFAFLGSFAVFVGLGGAIAAFVVINLGILPAVHKWALRRQMGVMAVRAGFGAKKTATAIEGLKEIESALERP